MACVQQLLPFTCNFFPSQHHHHHGSIFFTPTRAKFLQEGKKGLPVLRRSWKSKWLVRLGSAEQAPPTSVNVGEFVDFLYADLPHLFDEQGIDRSMYDEKVMFRDPITKYDTIDGYLFNIGLLRILFRPLFQLHSVKQTGPYEITTRWTMTMKFSLLPWKPELVFTGTSVMGINPLTRKFSSHVDFWDSIKQNDYFSLEGLVDFIKQLRIYKTPDLESPKYQVLKRTANYEIRKYESFLVVETKVDKLSGSVGFNNVAGYIFGKNASSEKFKMTTPVFTKALDEEPSRVFIQIVLPQGNDLDGLPAPSEGGVTLHKVGGGIAAAVKFSGETTEAIVAEKEAMLRSALLKDHLKPKEGCMFARYNDPGRTRSFLRRNEVLIWLEEFTLD
ncbi:Heme-binding-like protein [Nymphaea thermarum]|nr:Heme-binding-like protein [Nymphaea thermarum]